MSFAQESAMKNDQPFTPMTGGCNCGKLRFRMESAPMITHCCHCLVCQKASGSAFRVNAMIETDRLTITQGTPEPFHGAGSRQVVRCADCGFAVWSHHPRLGEAIAFVGVGMLDHGERLPPEAHYFTRSKHPWVTLPEGVPVFAELGDPGKPSVGARIAAALAGAGGGPPAR
jgi:hypothetical protein